MLWWLSATTAGAMDPVRSAELRVDLTGPHKLTERVRNAVEFFLRDAKP
jgi:hypothetical protein